MIRTLNFLLVAVTVLTCLGLYRIAEAARVASADLRETRAAIAREQGALVVLGAEWARLTQPARIEALAQRHLDLSDRPAATLSSLTKLPPKVAPLAPDSAFRNANMLEPAPGSPAANSASAHTGT